MSRMTRALPVWTLAVLALVSTALSGCGGEVQGSEAGGSNAALTMAQSMGQEVRSRESSVDWSRVGLIGDAGVVQPGGPTNSGTQPPPACVPTSCQAEGKSCGSIPDGCGDTLDCGTCSGSETCGGGGTANVCGQPPTSTAGAACQAGAWSSFAQSFFTTSCTRCHSGFGSYSGVQADASNIESKLSSGQMPPSGGLDAASKSQILTWLGCGAPQ